MDLKKAINEKLERYYKNDIFEIANQLEKGQSIKVCLDSYEDEDMKPLLNAFNDYFESKEYHDKSITGILDILKEKKNFVKRYKDIITDELEYNINNVNKISNTNKNANNLNKNKRKKLRI